MEITIIYLATNEKITLPKGSPCPRVGDQVCMKGNEIKNVVGVTFDCLTDVVWVCVED